MTLAFMENGSIVADSYEGLRTHLIEEYDGSIVFRQYIIDITGEEEAYDVLASSPKAYRMKLEEFVDFILADMEEYGIVKVDLVPVNEREYKITSLERDEPWFVTGQDASEYYEHYDRMDVGDVHSNTAYTVVRTKNMKPRARKKRKLFGRK